MARQHYASRCRRHICALGPLVAVLLLIGSCSGNNVTLAQADGRVLDLMRQVTAIVGGDPDQVLQTASQIQACESELQRGLTGQQGVSRSLELNGLAIPNLQVTGAAVRSYAEAQGFHVSVVTPLAAGGERTFYSDKDGYQLAVGVSPRGASVGANSPCVWPNGTPP